MTDEQIVKDFAVLKGDWNLMNSRPGESRSDNGALWTTEYYLCLKRLGILTGYDLDEYEDIMNQLIDSEGFTYRQPGLKVIDSPDNLIAFAVGSKAFGCDFAKRILRYGRTTFPRYVYNPKDPGKFKLEAWMGRQPGLIGFLKLSADEWVNPFEWLFLYVGIFLTMKKPFLDTSDKLLTELIVEQLPDSFMSGFVKRKWREYLEKNYNGINGVVSIFFTGENPFKKWWF